jgi:hypothetical protein
MKKLSLIVAGLSVLVGLTVQAADTNAVTSANIVGLIRQDLPSNKLVFVAFNMNTVGATTQTFGQAIGDQLPVGTWAYFWNSTSQTWDRNSRKTAAKGGWGVYSNRIVNVGEGIFLTTTTNFTANFLGEVPLAPTTTVPVVERLNALGLSYPVDTPWTNSALSSGLPNGSSFSVWDITNGWAKYTKFTSAKGGWKLGTNVIIRAGEACFVETPPGYSTNFFEVRPFTP